MLRGSATGQYETLSMISQHASTTSGNHGTTHVIDFPDMVPPVCPTCRTEAPLGSRFCGMCGQPLAPAVSETGGGDSVSEDSAPPPQDSEQPSLGHQVRASSPDRRVQTSPVGTVLPMDVLSALTAAAVGSAVATGVGRDDTPRRPPSVPPQRMLTRPIPQVVTDEPTVPIVYRPARTKASVGYLRTALFGLLWLLLAGLVAMAVVWILPDRQAPPPAPVASPMTAPRTEPLRATRPSGKMSQAPTAVTSAAPNQSVGQSGGATQSPGGVASNPATPATLTAEAAPTPMAALPQPGGAAAVASTASDAAGQLRGAERAAWQQDLANIEFVATTYSAQVRACYERAIRGLSGEPPTGRVELLFELSEDGYAQRVAVLSDSLGLPILGTCLSQRLTEWRFPRPVGPLRTFRFPFVFAGSHR